MSQLPESQAWGAGGAVGRVGACGERRMGAGRPGCHTLLGGPAARCQCLSGGAGGWPGRVGGQAGAVTGLPEGRVLS